MLTYTGVHLDRISQTGHAVLFLHAFPLSSAMWVEQLGSMFQHRVAAIAPNIYGVEGSDTKEPWSFADYCDELAPLLGDLGIVRATVVGLSMGGYQAFELYRRYPGIVNSMVLCDTRAEADTPEALENRWAFIEAVTNNGPEEAYERMLPNVFAPGAAESNPLMAETFRSIIVHQSTQAITSAMRAIAERPDSTAMLDTITCPVTLVTGREDSLTPPSLARSMHNRITDSTLHILPGAGHLSNMEQPAAFNDLLLDHLGRTGELPEA
ncbi:alpha/beta fold hydrolase [Prosthecochloris sp. HL-130-GSB]|jgi:3-oxoadipate enol-lactonase|uniref:alpha/beta fold hydrolase n=1 Tax=Prosthecochloris sp. HL-130-GSB TaxID=1974213 RepID=UPI000A1C1293|nr:alpha/beta fold hydrolase [Prosthecochloris sp. HL-130-GSB]ARM31521.1 alpha/beta hydrolase [Prosthecochloris sp. HL-130-GSB]MBO8093568.1 alpha/beta fold hydrolase [Prosthecochloris sp.]